MESLNEAIKQTRAAAGLTQPELGKLVGVRKSYICDIESGRKNISEAHARQIIEAMGKTLTVETKISVK